LNFPSGLDASRLRDREGLLHDLDRLRGDVDRSGEFAGLDKFSREALEIVTNARAQTAFDLAREDAATRDRYGRTTAGQGCLLARRLVEARVPYVQVNWSQYVEAMTPNCDFGWDTHIYNFEMLMDRHCPILDRVFSALLDDMQQRGLLEHTLVIGMGEFGRTPKINGQASRDHWPNCYFSIWAGAGIRPGRVIGESDKLGQDPITEPITPEMMGTTILHLAGLDSQARAEFRVLPGGRVIDELV